MSEQIAVGIALTLAFALALAALGLVIEGIARFLRRLGGRGLRGPSC